MESLKEHAILFFAMFALCLRMAVSMWHDWPDFEAERAARFRYGVGNTFLDD